MTYADYVAMPDDGHRYQVISGELIMTPAPSIAHQDSLQSLFRLTDDYVRRDRAGRVYIAPCNAT